MKWGACEICSWKGDRHSTGLVKDREYSLQRQYLCTVDPPITIYYLQSLKERGLVGTHLTHTWLPKVSTNEKDSCLPAFAAGYLSFLALEQP